MKISSRIRIFYCLPFAFMAVNGDATSGTMLFYAIMIVGLALLCGSALKNNRIIDIYVGNGLSFLASFIAAKVSGLEAMGYYFKPFTSHSLILVISIVAIIIQTIVVLVYSSGRKSKNNRE